MSEEEPIQPLRLKPRAPSGSESDPVDEKRVEDVPAQEEKAPEGTKELPTLRLRPKLNKEPEAPAAPQSGEVFAKEEVESKPPPAPAVTRSKPRLTLDQDKTPPSDAESVPRLSDEESSSETDAGAAGKSAALEETASNTHPGLKLRNVMTPPQPPSTEVGSPVSSASPPPSAPPPPSSVRPPEDLLASPFAPASPFAVGAKRTGDSVPVSNTISSIKAATAATVTSEELASIPLAAPSSIPRVSAHAKGGKPAAKKGRFLITVGGVVFLGVLVWWFWPQLKALLPSSEELVEVAAETTQVNRAQEKLTERREAQQARVDAVIEGREPTAPVLPLERLEQEGGVTTVVNEVIAIPEPRVETPLIEIPRLEPVPTSIPASDGLVRFAREAQISGVFQGTPARASINGRMVRAGEMVEPMLGIVFVDYDVASRNLIFRERSGAEMMRKFP